MDRRNTATLLKFGGVTFVVCLVLGVVAIFAIDALKKHPIGSGFVQSNKQVTFENYVGLRTGLPLADIERVLGPGRQPSSKDFDAICGTDESRFVNPFFTDRERWEMFAKQGQILVWSNGNVRIMGFFDRPAAQGGVLVRKMLQEADGSVSSESGPPIFSGTGPIPNFLSPNAPGNQSPSGLPKSIYTLGELMGILHADPTAAARFQNKTLTIYGTIEAMPAGVIEMKVFGGTGKLQGRLNSGITAGTKRVGDPIAVKGRIASYSPDLDLVVLDGCTLE